MVKIKEQADKECYAVRAYTRKPHVDLPVFEIEKLVDFMKRMNQGAVICFGWEQEVTVLQKVRKYSGPGSTSAAFELVQAGVPDAAQLPHITPVDYINRSSDHIYVPLDDGNLKIYVEWARASFDPAAWAAAVDAGQVVRLDHK